MAVLNFERIDGTQSLKFQLAATANGVVLKNDSGNLDIRNAGDTAFANTNVADIILNGSTYTTALAPSASQTASYTLTLPVNTGTTGQVLSTDGSGVLSWVSAASTSACLSYKTTSLAFGAGATTSIFTLPANAVIDSIQVIVDTAFNGTPTLSVGIAANNSKYVGSGDNNLTVAAAWTVYPSLPADSSSEALNIYYSAGSASTGTARVLVSYAVPA